MAERGAGRADLGQRARRRAGGGLVRSPRRLCAPDAERAPPAHGPAAPRQRQARHRGLRPERRQARMQAGLSSRPADRLLSRRRGGAA